VPKSDRETRTLTARLQGRVGLGNGCEYPYVIAGPVHERQGRVLKVTLKSGRKALIPLAPRTIATRAAQR
jgi:hypothetical protein